jgi:SAM-dependent methyltransferase
VHDALGIRDAVNALDEHELEGVLGVAGGLLTQAADQVSNPARAGWDYEVPSILMAQGHLSSLFAGALERFVLPTLGADLEDRLRAPGASFLDIGVGVAALAIAMCRLLPELRVVGVDPWQPALALARENVAAAGLHERIELRELTAEALTDAGEYDLAWLPTVFMRDPALEQATERVHAALRPGGWAILALYARPDDPLPAAVADLRTVRQGGAVRTPEELAAMLSRAGFAGVEIVTDRSPGRWSSSSSAGAPSPRSALRPAGADRPRRPAPADARRDVRAAVSRGAAARSRTRCTRSPRRRAGRSPLPAHRPPAPASTNPSGSSASDAIQSYDVTRESLSGGTRSASAVSHQTSKSSTPTPPIAIAGPTTTSGSPLA